VSHPSGTGAAGPVRAAQDVAMPIGLFPPLILLFLLALAVAAMELRSALQPPVCPQCGHCRLETLRRQAREEEARAKIAKRMWGIDDHDDDPRPPSGG
jgi:hypothetical protein